MLTDFEKKEVLKLLNDMVQNDLLSLAETVTNQLVVATSRQEAFDVICTYSQDPASLLSRKRVTRKLIFQYLHSEKVPVNADADKKYLINSVVEYWKLKDANKNTTEVEVANNLTPNAPTQSLTPANDTNIDVRTMVHKFGEWFYTMLNDAANPSSNFNPEHFWPDCKMMQKSNTDGDISLVGSRDVAKHLMSLVTNYSLMFNPNLMDHNLNVKYDPHGLILANFCGTLIRLNKCIGTFDQSFGLIMDPTASNAWKIKFTNLNVRVGQGVESANVITHAQHKMIE